MVIHSHPRPSRENSDSVQGLVVHVMVMLFYYFNFTGYRAAYSGLTTGTHFAINKSQHTLKGITKAGLEALGAFRSAF